MMSEQASPARAAKPDETSIVAKAAYLTPSLAKGPTLSAITAAKAVSGVPSDA